jgi:predicted ArsR family transcriptional regulator
VTWDPDSLERRSLLVAQAHVLANPRRYKVLRGVIDSGNAGVGAAELSEQFGITRAGIRMHLTRLAASGLITAREVPPTGPGRPRLRYFPTAAARRWWCDGDPFEQLSRLLEATDPAECTASRMSVTTSAPGALRKEEMKGR